MAETIEPDASARFRVSAAMERVARALGCTDGQAYSLVLTFAIALVLASVGLPATLRDVPRRDVAAPSLGASPAMSGPPVESRIVPPDVVAVTGVTPTPASSRSLDHSPSAAEGATAADPPSGPAFADGGSFGDIFEFASVPRPGAAAGVAVLSDGAVLVSTDNGSERGDSAGDAARVFHFSPAGQLIGTYAGDTVPVGSERGLSDVVRIGDGAVLAIAPTQAVVLRIDLTGDTAGVFGRIPDVPSCLGMGVIDDASCEPSFVDNPPLPVAAAADPKSGVVYVTDSGQATIWRFPPGGGAATVVHQSRDYTIDGGLAGITVDGDGHLVFTATRSQTAGGGGAVYLLDVHGDGTSGARTELATTGAESAPAGLTIGASGRVYVVLSGAGKVVVLEPDGTEAARFPTDTGTWDEPADVALRGRSLLVTIGSPSDLDRSRVVRIALASP